MSHTAAVLTISDKGARGERIDTSGPAICELLRQSGYDIAYTAIIPDEQDLISGELISCCDVRKIGLVVTTGGTGFSPRDVTPEATLSVIERETPGIPEAMRAESLRITPKGCLSRSRAGIRGGSLIVNLPGSEKAARENLQAVLSALDHGLEMLASSGSADCAAPSGKKISPSLDVWLKEAKDDPAAADCGMFLVHNGTVRRTARALVRDGDESSLPVTGLLFDYDERAVQAAVDEALTMEGIRCVRVWLNRGKLAVGDDIMFVLVGGDIRLRVISALDHLVARIKTDCVTEKELY